MHLLLLALGLVLLTVGADLLVRGASALARRLGVPALAIGLTIVAYGTSAPELVVSVQSALQGLGDVSLGNVVGSNIFNILVVLGLAAAIRPVRVQSQVLRLDAPVVVVVSLALVAVVHDGTISRTDAALLLTGALGYTAISFWAATREGRTKDEPGLPDPISVPRSIAFLLAGLGLLVGGSSLLVDNAVAIAQALAVDEAIIGLTIVAAGTSLPELVTSAVAAVRGEDDIAIGNVLGSNTFNVLGILGVAGVIRPLRSPGIETLDLAFLVATPVVLLPFLFTGRQVSRVEGGILLAAYVAYLALRWPA